MLIRLRNMLLLALNPALLALYSPFLSLLLLRLLALAALLAASFISCIKHASFAFIAKKSCSS